MAKRRLSRVALGYRDHPIRLVMPMLLGLLTFGMFTLAALALTGHLGTGRRIHDEVAVEPLEIEAAI
ncbi:MAG TPA: hypothetical protein VKR30_06195 [Candidatus Limnocylindrales bacterium]|nr:hypothetical protein [Candidatus Limnocylindrales bacterium]